MLTIVAWKWGRKYGAGHVKRLRAMLARHLHQPHRIVCLTDRPEDVPAGVIPQKLPPPPPNDRKCLRRMWLYSREAARCGDRLLQLDLDLVITDAIDPLVDRAEPFVIWRSESNTRHGWAYNATVMLITPGAKHDQVWAPFAADPVGVMKRADHDGWWANVNSDQAAATYLLKDDPDVPYWTAADGILSYRAFAGKHGERGATLPPGARIVSFHGPRDPSLPALQARSPWIADHWRC